MIGKKVIDSIGLAGISRKSQKEGGTSEMADDSHRVLEELLCIAVATCKARRQDDATAQFSRVNILTQEAIRQSVKDIGPDILLVRPPPIECGLLAGRKSIVPYESTYCNVTVLYSIQVMFSLED